LDLIDETSTSWKEDLVKACFINEDATTILSIPLCTRRQSNFCAWSFVWKGLFSVRPAYRMMVNMKVSCENYFKGNLGSSGAETEVK
jgi:hypothetical protein